MDSRTSRDKVEGTVRQIGKSITHVGCYARDVDYANQAQKVKRYVQEHPRQTAVHVSSLALLIAPGLLVAPVLGAVGFGVGGVVAGMSDDISLVIPRLQGFQDLLLPPIKQPLDQSLHVVRSQFLRVRPLEDMVLRS